MTPAFFIFRQNVVSTAQSDRLSVSFHLVLPRSLLQSILQLASAVGFQWCCVLFLLQCVLFQRVFSHSGNGLPAL